MNLKLIDAAIAGYEPDLDEGDRARLAFFRTLWGVQDECAQALEKAHAGGPAYHVPKTSEIKRMFHADTPVFAEAPVDVDADALASALDRIGATLVEGGLFPAEVNEALDRVKWDRVVAASGVALAGEQPSAWLENLAEVLVDDGMTDNAAHVGALIASLALKVQIEGPAHDVMAVVADVNQDTRHPLLCPVCGTAPTMAHVGGKTSSAGRGRLLVCPQCGSAWEFERVRCAHCGTQNQAHLHFFNVEGDDAHRIATCDECGGYMRTLYSADALSPCAYEVEDVVMARLDAIAMQPYLARGESGAGADDEQGHLG